MADRYQSLRDLPFPVVAGVISADISRFKPRKGNTEWAGPCPVHQPKKNSTSFSYSANGKWNCFSCSAKGRGAIDLLMAVQRIGFQAAVEILEPYAGPAVQHQAPRIKPEIKLAHELPTENPPFKGTYEKFKVESAWLKERGLQPATLERFGVFQYENPSRRSTYNGSVLIRISRYSDGECVGYLSRNIGEVTPERPKYALPSGLHKSLELFGAFQLKEDHQLPVRICYLVESPFTVMKFWQHGLPAVSPFGWSLSPQQIDIMAELAKGYVCLPDADKTEAFSPCAHQLSKRVWLRCPPMPDGVADPEHLSLEQIKALT